MNNIKKIWVSLLLLLTSFKNIGHSNAELTTMTDSNKEPEVKQTRAEFIKNRFNFDVSEELITLIDSVNSKFKLPDSIIYPLIDIESKFKENAISQVGAQGLMQIMPSTFEYIKTQTNKPLNIKNPVDNLWAGMWYLTYLRARVKNAHPNFDDVNHWRYVLASYNAGYSVRVKALTRYPETKAYVGYIMSHYDA